MACKATLGNPRHVGENTYLVKVIEIFSDIDGKNIPDFKIDILRKMSEKNLSRGKKKRGKIFGVLFAKLIDGQPRRNTCRYRSKRRKIFKLSGQ